ncbi:MAG: radical SAM protein [Candidatus Liptonbacteria bacterium]|nr:radical SAM protein [Candidatus Liptonbacteria bacterium]
MQLEFDWHLTNRCNFDCVYCHPQIKIVLNRLHLNEPHYSLVVRRFNDLQKTCAILMSGGEPLLYPDFVELCAGLTQRHYLSINTNLSLDIAVDFAHRVDPCRIIGVTAALHQVEREIKQGNIDIYLKNFLLLQRKRFNITALYVLYPPLLDRFVDDLRVLEEAGVNSISPKVFKGVYKGRRYPDNYTDEEKEKILRHKYDYRFNTAYLDDQMCFRGQSCTAGSASFKIDVTGHVQRCATVKGDYGNLYEGTFVPSKGPEPCTANRVLCISQCHRYLVRSPIRLDVTEEE